MWDLDLGSGKPHQLAGIIWICHEPIVGHGSVRSGVINQADSVVIATRNGGAHARMPKRRRESCRGIGGDGELLGHGIVRTRPADKDAAGYGHDGRCSVTGPVELI